MISRLNEVSLLVKSYFSTLNIPHTTDVIEYYTHELEKSKISIENINKILRDLAINKKLLTIYEIEKTINKLKLNS